MLALSCRIVKTKVLFSPARKRPFQPPRRLDPIYPRPKNKLLPRFFCHLTHIVLAKPHHPVYNCPVIQLIAGH